MFPQLHRLLQTPSALITVAIARSVFGQAGAFLQSYNRLVKFSLFRIAVLINESFERENMPDPASKFRRLEPMFIKRTSAFRAGKAAEAIRILFILSLIHISEPTRQ